MFTRHSDRENLDFKAHSSGREMAEQISHNIYGLHSMQTKEALADFTKMEYRMEFVRDVNHIFFVNDAKSVSVNSTWYTLECANKPVIWIAGGIDQGQDADYSVLESLVKHKVKALVCLGANSDVLNRYFGKKIDCIINANSFVTHDPVGLMRKVASLAYNLAVPGDTILLSPAADSSDYFDSYEQKGWAFKKAVLSL